MTIEIKERLLEKVRNRNNDFSKELKDFFSTITEEPLYSIPIDTDIHNTLHSFDEALLAAGFTSEEITYRNWPYHTNVPEVYIKRGKVELHILQGMFPGTLVVFCPHLKTVPADVTFRPVEDVAKALDIVMNQLAARYDEWEKLLHQVAVGDKISDINENVLTALATELLADKSITLEHSTNGDILSLKSYCGKNKKGFLEVEIKLSSPEAKDELNKFCNIMLAMHAYIEKYGQISFMETKDVIGYRSSVTSVSEEPAEGETVVY